MIKYYSYDLKYVFPNKRVNTCWIKSVIASETNESKIPGEISIIFCSDNYILEVNNKFLKHNYFTDVITFNYNEGNFISGDIFISIDTVKQNSLEYSVDFNLELKRVIVHAILHLLGFDDRTKKQKALMTQKENFYLNIAQL